MLSPTTQVLLRHPLPNFSSPIQEIYACSSCGKYVILDDDNREVCFLRRDFLLHFPRINTAVRVTNTGNHFFPMGTIVKITGITFNEDNGQRYLYKCEYSGLVQYLRRKDFKLI